MNTFTLLEITKQQEHRGTGKTRENDWEIHKEKKKVER